MLKVGIVGCGQIAEAHIDEIRKTKLASVECICDLEPIMAEQLARRYSVSRYYTNLSRMLDDEKLDALHITTPPQSHFTIATEAIDRGCHVLVEKPMTLNFENTKALIGYATDRGKIITAGYPYYYDPPAEALRSLVHEGRIGTPVHLESFFGYDLSGAFGTSIMNDAGHWVHRLPGKLFQNNIDHLIYRFVEYLPVSDFSEIKIVSYRRDGDRKFNDERDALKDELRVVIRSGDVTAIATFSSSVKPVSHFLKVYGTRAIAAIDYNSRSVVIEDGTSFPTALGRALLPFKVSRRYFDCGIGNLRAFYRHKFHYFSGFRKLFEKFYVSIQDHQPPPIPYEYMLRTSYLVDYITRNVSENTLTL